MTAENLDRVSIDQIDILDVGNLIQIGGGIWTGKDKMYIVPLPDEDLSGQLEVLEMSTPELERFLNQTDVLDIRGPGKAILRKSQRQIDQHISWQVFERDGYRCRYCGRKGPLTVDHVILWEAGGATVVDNLVSCCRKDNKTRGSMEYGQWLDSREYKAASRDLDQHVWGLNESLREELPRLRKIKAKPRSR